MNIKELLELLVKLIEAGAWPSLVAYVAINYRNEFRSILKRLDKAKFGEAEISLSKEQAEEAVVKASEQAINLLKGSFEKLEQFNELSANEEIDKAFAVRTADIDGDGRDELIISTLEGPYSSHVRIFKPMFKRDKDYELITSFNLIGEICPVNSIVDIRDIDSGKHSEIVVIEYEKGSDKPHAAGLKEKVVYKFIKGKLKEISREKITK
jgi:hypothetical protein